MLIQQIQHSTRSRNTTFSTIIQGEEEGLEHEGLENEEPQDEETKIPMSDTAEDYYYDQYDGRCIL